ncbi:MAG TPA: WXG100 family type VII secretion target [Aggregatilineales bacterium]|nr:WXG100 family type VII secretion target [Anaerolineales bacterium]HRE46121.1 WXG100 family type VII secretion target [Aggregatilineales bacterium]
MANRIQADYDSLSSIRQMFARHAEKTNGLLNTLRHVTDTFAAGGWVGSGADAYQREMADRLFPALKTLIESLNHAAQMTEKIAKLLGEAEAEAAALFGGAAVGAGLFSQLQAGVMGGGISDLINNLTKEAAALGTNTGSPVDGVLPTGFDKTKYGSDVISLMNSLGEALGMETGKFGKFASGFGIFMDAWEQMNAGRGVVDAAGVAGTKFGIESLLFSTPVGRGVLIVNDLLQVTGKAVIISDTATISGNTAINPALREAFSAQAKANAENVGKMDVKNVVRDTAGTAWDLGKFAFGGFNPFNTPADHLDNAKQVSNSVGQLGETAGKFIGGVLSSPRELIDYQIARDLAAYDAELAGKGYSPSERATQVESMRSALDWQYNGLVTGYAYDGMAAIGDGFDFIGSGVKDLLTWK